MKLDARIVDDLKKAMKEGDRIRIDTLRMVRSRIQEATVKRRGEEGRDALLTDDDVTQVIAAYAKQRRDSITSYRDAGREELATKEEAELALLQDYLPEQLAPEVVREIVTAAIEETGASSPGDMGKVMGKVMPQVRGKADGKVVKQIVRELLSG